MTINPEVLEAANQKFGEVVSIRKHINNGLVLIIRRDEPANPELPFMTIRAFSESDGTVSFTFGHYDLAERAAFEDFATR